MNNLSYEMHALLNEMFENALVFLGISWVAFMAIVGFASIPALALYLLIAGLEMMLGKVPFLGKFLAKHTKEVKENYKSFLVNSFRMSVDVTVKLAISFFEAVTQGAYQTADFFFGENRPPTRRPPPRDQ